MISRTFTTITRSFATSSRARMPHTVGGPQGGSQNTVSPEQHTIKPTAWYSRKAQAYGISPVFAWGLAIGLVGAGAFYNYRKDDTSLSGARSGPPASPQLKDALEKK
ncbi:hypothetical protein JCM21900_000738 [Sporobolomyces salmonicolor]